MLGTIPSDHGTLPRNPPWIIALVCLGIVLGLGKEVTGQDFEDEEDEEAAAAVDPNAFVLSEQQFNSWIFDNFQTGIDRYQERFQSVLSVRVAELRRTCDLSESQVKMLELAGHGDLHRFFDLVEAKRRKLQGKSYPQNEMSMIFQELSPLREKLTQGLFEDGSLFAKVTVQLLDTQQRERLAEIDRDRRTHLYASDIERTLLRIGRVVGLTGSQREELQALILRETRPPRRMGQRSYGYWFVLVQMSRLPEKKLRPIFDDIQWPLARQYLQRGQGMIPLLRSNGYLDDDEDPATKPKAAAGEPDADD